jgi:hypothetical protein
VDEAKEFQKLEKSTLSGSALRFRDGLFAGVPDGDRHFGELCLEGDQLVSRDGSQKTF